MIDKLFTKNQTILSSTAVAGALLLGLFLVSPAMASGGWTVSEGSEGLCSVRDRHCATIQAAVDAAGDNSTITVTNGSYPENVVITDKKRLAIMGQGVGTEVEPATGIAFAIRNANNVSIKKMHIHTNGLDSHGIWVAGTPSGGAAMSGLVVQDNHFVVDGYSAAIYSEQSTLPHTKWLLGGVAHGNTIVVNPGEGVTGDGMDLHDLSNSAVSYNDITLNTPTNSTAVLWTSEYANLTNLVFKKNHVSGSSGSEVAIVNNFIEPGTTTISGVNVTENSFENWGSRALRIGARTTAVTVKKNSFNDVGQVLSNESPTTIMAEYNWWNNPNPVWGEILAGSVEFDPWYTTEAMTNLSSEKNILNFSLTNGSARISNATGIITLSLPKGIDPSALAPVIEVSPGATVEPASGQLVDFTTPQVYIVTAADGTMKSYGFRVLLDQPVMPGRRL